MKRLIVLFIIFLFSHNLFAGDNEEFRATWIITWDLIHAGYSIEENQTLCRQILDNHQNANLNAVLWQTRQSGTAYYESSYEPWGYYVGNKHPGYDPLAYAIQEAHKRGLELHAWFNVFHASAMVPGAPAYERPEWVCTNIDGETMTSKRCLSPGIADVRNYLINVAVEIVRNYDVDGIHFDFIRWNEYDEDDMAIRLSRQEEISVLDGQATEKLLKKLSSKTGTKRYFFDQEHPYSAGIPEGFNSWADWRRWCVTEFVRVFNDSAKAVKPWVRVSVASLGRYNWDLGIGWDAYNTVFQDAALWFNEGYIDQLMPMHYHWSDYQSFYNMLVGPLGNSTSDACWGYYIQKGLADGRLYSCGPSATDLAKNNPRWRNPHPMVNAARAVPWVDGLQFFSYGDWKDWQYWDKAKEELYFTKTKIRATKLIVSTSPETPAIEIAKIDSLNYQISVTPPASVVTNHRYAIYRSPDEYLDLDNDEIIDIHFGDNSAYSFVESFSGTQDHDDSYFYAATVIDRYWNESEVSNIEQTDPIPSFPPTIISTFPTEGDTVSINSLIIINFSKTMDVSSLQKTISITPIIEIAQLNWFDGNKTLKILMAENFLYANKYTVTIDPTLTDINGKSLDGDGDGNGGDPYIFHFRTKTVDDIGPQVLFSYPHYNMEIDTFDVEEVITIIFNELISEQTVYDSTLILKQNDEEISIQFLISTIADKSLISLKSFDPLLTNTNYSLLLSNTITDTSGNQMDSDIQLNFSTSDEYYLETTLIDDFVTTASWKQPEYSGSTSGIVAAGTAFGNSKYIYLPASWTRPYQKRSAFLSYQWLETQPPEGYLLREFLYSGPPRDVVFDTTYTLQCYVYGDDSNNKFRFCIDEKHGANWSDHEVSKWITINWIGWRLLEWNLNDPNSVGDWIGNSILDGSFYRIDSFQLTHDSSASVTGKIYFDNLRLVKKSTEITGVNEKFEIEDISFKLRQNYPNPFNSSTKIYFYVPAEEKISLKIYNYLGREVRLLINDEKKQKGHHQLTWDGIDNFGNQAASGMYIYSLKYGNFQVSKRMMLVR